MFDELDFIGFLTGTWDLLSGKNEASQSTARCYTEQITPKIYSFRPQNFEEYIGQQNAKELIQLNIDKIKQTKPVHFLLSGNKGCGKTSIANIIARTLDFEINWYIAGAFTSNSLRDFLQKNQDAEIPQVLFIDEIHGLDKSIAEYLYPILEDFILPEKNIKLRRFIFIGATTERNILLKKFSPLVDRCGADIVLETYTANDIKAILKQYNDKIYKANITEEVYNTLAANTRFTPRVALNFFDDLIVCKNITKTLKIHRVVTNGLTDTDILVLKHLKEVTKPVGVEALAMIVGTTKEDFVYCIEPYLIYQAYMSRTARGRIITEKGQLLLNSL